MMAVGNIPDSKDAKGIFIIFLMLWKLLIHTVDFRESNFSFDLNVHTQIDLTLDFDCNYSSNLKNMSRKKVQQAGAGDLPSKRGNAIR